MNAKEAAGFRGLCRWENIMSDRKSHTSTSYEHAVSLGINQMLDGPRLELTERELTKKLNRRGAKLRVKRRGQGNGPFAERQLAEIKRRYIHAGEHIQRLAHELIDCERYREIARGHERSRKSNGSAT